MKRMQVNAARRLRPRKPRRKGNTLSPAHKKKISKSLKLYHMTGRPAAYRNKKESRKARLNRKRGKPLSS